MIYPKQNLHNVRIGTIIVTDFITSSEISQLTCVNLILAARRHLRLSDNGSGEGDDRVEAGMSGSPDSVRLAILCSPPPPPPVT